MTYRIERNRLRLRVSRLNKQTLTEEDCSVIDAWVVELNLGRRISWDIWKMNNSKSVGLFLLKWG